MAVKTKTSNLAKTMLGVTIASLPVALTIDYSPITNAVASGVNEWVNNGVSMIGAQTDMFSFLITVWVVTILGWVAFYFINKVRSNG